MYRGFHRNDRGKEIICLNGEQIRGTWVYGMHVHVQGAKLKYADTIVIPPGTQWVVVPETIGASVGKKDKHGVRVFDGDLLQINRAYFLNGCVGKAIVEYDTDYARFRVRSLSYDTQGLNYDFEGLDEFEVIGTKWDKGE